MRVAGTDIQLRDEDFPDVFHFLEWMVALSSPRTLQRMHRLPTRKHLLCLIEAYLPYARSRRRISVFVSLPADWWPDPEQREASALELRAVIEQWTGPLISSEITRTAWALLDKEGLGKNDEAWEAFDHIPELPAESGLVWPELPEFPTNRKRQS